MKSLGSWRTFVVQWLGLGLWLVLYGVLCRAQSQGASIAWSPESRNVAVGLDASFFGRATGTPPMVYQWQFEGTNLPGATLSSLSLTNIQPNQAGAYRLVATDTNSSATSAVAVLVVGRVAFWRDPVYYYYNLDKLPLDLTNVVKVATGPYHSLALLSDGRVMTWSDRGSGLTNVPTGLRGVKAIAAAGYSLALCADGTVKAWGVTEQ